MLDALATFAKSPKSDAFPVDAIVIKSIVFTLFPVPLEAVVPAANVPLMLLLLPDIYHLACVRSPKSCPLPSDLIVIKSILFTVVGAAFPPTNTPRVELEAFS